MGTRAVVEGLGGAARMVAALATPFDRPRRNRWGVADADGRAYPGDGLVPRPRWQWTHGIEIDAPVSAVWPWIVQTGADRGGFYSYEWLENLVGCGVRNADHVEPGWALRVGENLVLHPDAPVPVVAMEPGRWFVAHLDADADDVAAGRAWMAVSWLLHLEDLPGGRCRFVSRFRSASSDGLGARLGLGPTFIEPIGFVMDRRMLLGVKERAERGGSPAPAGPDPAGRRTPAGLTRAVRRDWRSLAVPTPDPAPFDPDALDHLPVPVARWLRHAVEPGTPLVRTLVLAMHGRILAGRWRPFRALQVLAPPGGFVWAASAGAGPARLRGFDRYTRGRGQMRWLVAGLVPVVAAADDDVTRSAAARLAAETFLLPAAAIDPAIVWHGVDDHHATAEVPLGGRLHRVDVEVDDDGALRRISLPRWGDPAGDGFGDHRFSVDLDGVLTVRSGAGAFVLPRSIEAGWDDVGVFFRATLDGALAR